ncbi:uncharacterized protein CANTADRAFT_23323 [Suhomyces tanzawaensis NRRL Y-17324]|uniref:Uncharacterized protein n=1 Tax=Suhomyces tanzawaensis NRRL Y-17324 TaxID=984487 RepID=A0A1E4SFD7_9ASCO|nr:uncharacterized protein CANTADRAFT_23323 [Suhomyces tanzawaensis NRRL Y-17324]ODV78228.1 hypothetical protein CANTADRAFT_23323 [Suhomyces tanzawaensis NRRL Y-17324]
MSSYPKVTIKYCSKCKWHNRAVWYLQELLQTFEGKLNEISLQPVVDQPGTFQVTLSKSPHEEEIIYKRRFKNRDLALKYGDKDGLQSESYYYDGFPDSKMLKVLVRDRLEGKVELGHIDKYDTSFLASETNECKSCQEAA